MDSCRPKIFAWGTFDNLHEGHKDFLKRIALLGKLHIIVVPSEKKYENSGYYPLKDAESRKYDLMRFSEENDNLIEAVHIDSYSNGLKSMLEHDPDFFCFGYDQSLEWQEKVMQFAKAHKLKTTFIRLAHANGGGEHSSQLRNLK